MLLESIADMHFAASIKKLCNEMEKLNNNFNEIKDLLTQIAKNTAPKNCPNGNN